MRSNFAVVMVHPILADRFRPRRENENENER